ncbi:MAG TPA: triose-phosphate isomerase [Thermoplasmata archaeon]|nr:triose-phosphate isomerase [Thermoplasmata archaeon]
MGTSTRSAPGRAAPRPRSPTEGPPLGSPLLLVNFKAYPEALGRGAHRLAALVERLSRAAGVPAAICPSASDLAAVAQWTGIPVLAQHTDPNPPGAHTGRLVAEALRAAGSRGSLVNHSERPLSGEEVGRVVRRLEEVDLVPVVCARDLPEAWRLASLRPAYLAIEPPELIGGDVSVSEARPALIEEVVDAVREISPASSVLVGAGVHRSEDVAAALRLGAQGVLVASAVARSSEPERALRELLKGFSTDR